MRRRQIGAVLLVIALVLGGAACSNQERPPADSPPDQTPAAEADNGTTASDAIDEPLGDETTPPENLAEAPDDTVPSTPDVSPAAEAVDEPGSSLPDVDEPPIDETVPPIPTVADALPVDPPATDDLQGIFEGAGAALANLESYRYTTTFVYAGVDNGEVEEGSIELQGAVAGNQRHLRWIDLSTGDSFEIIRIEEQAWMQTEGTWQEVPVMAAEAMSSAILVLAPAFSWETLTTGLPSSSTRVGPEPVNGIPATHYTSTFQEWGDRFDAELVHTQGDVWIADAGYPIKYAFTASGIDEDGDPGTLTWTMELRDVDGDIVIEPPAGASGGG